jgi:predicted  nucleic acid-binding Zn-ribbon protein
MRRHSQRESHSYQEAIHKLEREEGDLQREIDHLEGSTHKWRRRKTPSEG